MAGATNPSNPSYESSLNNSSQPSDICTSPARALTASNGNQPSPQFSLIGRWATFKSKVSATVGQKVDITVSRLAFIIGIVSVVAAVLSYHYGAASFRLAEQALELQQLDFCMTHDDEPVGPPSLQ